MIKKICNIIFHLNLVQIISFNLMVYCFGIINLNFSVLYAVSFSTFSLLFILLQGGMNAIRFRGLLPLLLFLLVLLINLLITQVDYGFFKFQALIARMFFGVLVIQAFLNLGYKVNTKVMMGLGIVISAIVVYHSSLTNFFSKIKYDN